ncbi:hypothetical protein QJS10_CPA02g00814 [Acorus calamus]|uniref:Uncharacterized protein n=1 Tax=Acorus calamus TaxID=4465 RepID=A0AAV9FBM2_ACOCL|nr:hypothetical protein QJS10_CPA02g00814 [Acorus calamus]
MGYFLLASRATYCLMMGVFRSTLLRGVHLDHKQGYELSYSSKVTGKVMKGSIKNIVGVKVKVLFAWLSITEVTRKEGSLQFNVGPLSASFELSKFEICPQCGCGFDCALLHDA